MSSPTSKINVRGFVESMTTKGFTPIHALSEAADNSLDAGATKIKIQLHCAEVSPLSGIIEPFLTISDNGRGMDYEKLNDCLTVHTPSDSADDKNGKYGVGLTHSLATISNQAGESVILSNTDSCSANEMCVNWPNVLKSGIWYPCASGVTVKYQYLAHTYGIPGAVSGTVIASHVDRSINNKILASSSDIINEMRVKYADYIRAGVNITLKFGTDDEVTLLPTDPLNIAVAMDGGDSKYMKTTLKIRKYGDVTRVYFNDRGNWMRLSSEPMTIAARYNKAPKVDIVQDGIGEDICEMTYENSYVPSDVEGEEGGSGATYIKRGKKVIARHANEAVTSGTYGRTGKRTVKEQSNHMLTYTSHGDRLIKTEGNKSRIEVDNIDLCLDDTMKYLKDLFYKKYSAEHPENPKAQRDTLPAALKAIHETVRSLIKNEQYCQELRELNDRFINPNA